MWTKQRPLSLNFTFTQTWEFILETERLIKTQQHSSAVAKNLSKANVVAGHVANPLNFNIFR